MDGRTACGRPERDLLRVPTVRDVTEIGDLPGHELLDLVGFGATGEVWRAREVATGSVVAVQRLVVPADLGELDGLRRRLAALDSPHLVRLRAVLPGPVLVLDLAGGGSLEALLRHRSSLHPGEVVTVAAPLAQALAEVHAAGLVHGDLRPSAVLFTSAGMPLLADVGLAAVLGQVAAPADDVRGLAVLCRDLLGSGVAAADARPLVSVLDAVLAGDVEADAAAFALALRRAAPARPVRLVGAGRGGDPGSDGARPAASGPSDGPAVPPAPADPSPARTLSAPGRHRARRALTPPRSLVLGLVVGLVLALAAGTGWALGGRGASAGARLPVASPGAVPWAAVLDGLDRAREAAYRAGDPAALGAVYAPASPGLVADTALLARLAGDGRSALGVRHEVRAVEQLAFDGTTARLRVRDLLGPHQLLGPDGTVVEQRPAAGERSSTVVVTRTPDGWRLAEVRPS